MKRVLTDLNLKNKKVLLRADFNVPLDENGNITDDTRIFQELPTIKYILKQGAKLIICSHLGRPKGEVNLKYSLFPVAQHLVRYLSNKIYFAVDTVGVDAVEKANNLKNGEILILENLRFYKEEEKNDFYFAKKLASLADVYVNDAFGTIHRKHASIHRVAKFMPENAMGFLVEKEIKAINKVMNSPERPFIAILGGAKVSDKIGVIKNLVEKADSLMIGGAMAFTFLKAEGYDIGKSIVDENNINVAKEIINKARAEGKQIYLPVDIAASEKYSSDSQASIFGISNFPKEFIGLDIGPKTIAFYKNVIKNGKTFVWNGPMGVFEFPNFIDGTEAVAKAISKAKGFSIVGGGDSVAAIKMLKLENKISHLSTGGGATLALLEGGDIPGLDALTDIKEN